ncbi:hypothetical protein D3C78_1425100 [compost metagenome]
MGGHDRGIPKTYGNQALPLRVGGGPLEIQHGHQCTQATEQSRGAEQPFERPLATGSQQHTELG